MTAITIIVLAITTIGLLAREGGKLSRETARADAWNRLEVDRYNR